MQKNYINELIRTLVKIDSRDNMKDFVEGILTPGELIEISQRLQIVKQLMSGVPQRQIAENLGVGVATITRGSREVKNGKFKVLNKVK